MDRVRNEEEYLEAAVSSVVDLVNELVIVDNLSTGSSLPTSSRVIRCWSGRSAEHQDQRPAASWFGTPSATS
jgi:hypothetical protein